MSEPLDLLVVGGGINGVAIARDAAGRGLSVMLCEAHDLAAATSSASSKLIHGGLRYLEQYAFRLVRESLAEREVLLRMAPHLIRPLRFVLPHDAGLRPGWMIHAGLFLYDHLGGRRSLPRARAVRLRDSAYGAPLQPRITNGYVYSDCRVDDARLVVVTARDAARRGAAIVTRTALTGARRDGGLWRATVQAIGGEPREITARILVNAAGPWVGEVLGRSGVASRAAVRLVKGSHIVVNRLYDGDHAYILQNDDRRVVFAIPYEQDFTLIGTTDRAFAGDPATVAADADEIAYLCRAVGRWFIRPPTPDDVLWSYSGVRPLYDDHVANASAVTRDYVFDLDEDGPPALAVFGGKLTTHRRLAEHALDKLAGHLPETSRWTAGSVLPGGDLPQGGVAALAQQLRRNYRFLDTATAARLARSYGTEALGILGVADSTAALGREFGHGLSEREVTWLVAEEWARTADDILWRRSKLGLHAGAEIEAALAAHLAGRRATV